jgi:diguanylate cyclase (GGDEF)-like protein/PAS domain S-box-containing protein
MRTYMTDATAIDQDLKRPASSRAGSKRSAETPRHRGRRKDNGVYFRYLSENSLAGEYALQYGRVIYVNPALARMFGYKPSDLIGGDLLIVIHPDDRPLVAEKIRVRTAGNVQPLHFECRGLHKDGCVIDIQVLGGVTILLDGRPASIGTILEITGRKRAEKQLQKLSLVVEQSPASVVITDSDGNIEYVNPRFTSLTGYTMEEVIGRNPRILKSGLTAASTYQELWETILSGREWRGEIINKKKTGELYWESASISPIKDAAGVITHFIAVKEDITERKMAEDALRKAEQEYRRLFAEAVEGIFRTSPEGKLIVANPALARSLGYASPEEVVSSISDMGQQVWMDSTEWQAFARLLERQGVVRGYECQFRRKDGAIIWASLNAHTSLGPGGGIQYYEGSFEDITRRRQATEALEEAHGKLARSMRVLKSRSDEITMLSEFGRLLQSCRSCQEAYRVIKTYCQKLFPSFSGGVYLTTASRNLVQGVISWGESEASEPNFAPDDCWALRSGRLHCVEDRNAPAQCGHMLQAPEVAYLCMPLMAQGEAMGIVHVECHADAAARSSEEWEEFKRSRQELASAIAEHVALALANLQLRETLRNQSIRDALTGLFNRRYVEESLEREILRAHRSNSTIGILLLDTDHFKRYNDTFGHEAGDAILREVGLLLKKQVRGEDIPCRYGGEEFLLIMPEAPIEIARQRAEQFREAVRDLKVNFHGQVLGTITISVGVAMYPQHGGDAESVLESADKALYEAKESGRNRVVLATSRAEGK